MPSDETLRVALVCTLPLLHFSPSLVAVVHVDSPLLSSSVSSMEL
jgi:hypothetical protein